ncbi:hypothetical protein ABIB50_000080 [Mucilaginibacter sp. UYCu711]
MSKRSSNIHTQKNLPVREGLFVYQSAPTWAIPVSYNIADIQSLKWYFHGYGSHAGILPLKHTQKY